MHDIRLLQFNDVQLSLNCPIKYLFINGLDQSSCTLILSRRQLQSELLRTSFLNEVAAEDNIAHQTKENRRHENWMLIYRSFFFVCELRGSLLYTITTTRCNHRKTRSAGSLLAIFSFLIYFCLHYSFIT